jgi:hypothetical protein
VLHGHGARLLFCMLCLLMIHSVYQCQQLR